MKITLKENELIIDGEGDALYLNGKNKSASDSFKVDLGEDMKHIVVTVTNFIINTGGIPAISVPASTLIEQ